MTLAVGKGSVKSRKGDGGKAGATEYRLGSVLGTVLDTGVAGLGAASNHSVDGGLTVADEPLAGGKGVDEGGGVVHRYIQSKMGGEVKRFPKNLTY